jgi:general secretion pathway protein A
MDLLSLIPHFRNTRAPDYFFESKEHLEALERLRYAIESEEKLAILTGEIGAGKTFTKTVFKTMLRQEDYQVVDIPDSSGTFNQILYNIICELRGEKILKGTNYRTNVLKKFFEEELGKIAVDKGKYLVTFLDDAQAMGGTNARPSTRKAHLEQIRLLTNIDLLDKNLMTIILIGQPELRRYIAELPQLEDRAAPPYHLNAFDYNTTHEYINFRLSKGGATDIFSTDAVKIILSYSKGLPRRITRMCYVCLYVAGNFDLDKVDDRIAQIVYDDFRSGNRRWERDAKRELGEQGEETD